MSLPYGLDAWYPLTHGRLNAPQVLGENAPASADEIREAWLRTPPGQALVIIDAVPAPQAKGMIRRLGRPSMAARMASELCAGGRVDRWHIAPGTGGSHVLLPARRGGIEAGLPLLPAGRRRWRVARGGLLLAERLGLGECAGFGELLVAAKERRPSLPACQWIAERPSAITPVSLGVPGLLRKATLRVCRSDGQVEGYLKLSMGDAARARVSHEAETLERLGRTMAECGLAPRLLDRGETLESAWLVQSPLTGQRSPDRLTDAHTAFLSKLAQHTATALPFSELGAMRAARKHLDVLRTRVEPEWIRVIEDLIEAISSALAGREIPCTLAHGDFTPWNLALDGSHLAAFDWEFADWTAPALSDLVHFHLQTGILVRRVSAATLLDELGEVLRGPALQLLTERGLSYSDALAYIGLEVLRAATADEHLNSIERPPFAQVKWLRDTRLELAQLITGRLCRVPQHEERAA